jgi:hypothetical protein
MTDALLMIAKLASAGLAVLAVELVAEGIVEAALGRPLRKGLRWLGRRWWVDRLRRAPRPWWLVAVWTAAIALTLWAVASAFRSTAMVVSFIAAPTAAIALTAWWRTAALRRQ